jgi:hypothetical protein
MSKDRLKEVRDRLNDIWYSGYGPAGGDIRPEHREEFNALLNEEHKLLSEEYERLYGEKNEE